MVQGEAQHDLPPRPRRSTNGRGVGELGRRSAPRAGRTRGERGQAVVELALILPVLAGLVLATIDLGRAFSSYSAVAHAAREGARYWSLHPGDTGGTQTRVSSALDGRVPGAATAIAAVDDTCASTQPGCPVAVTVTGPFTPITPYIQAIAGSTLGVTATATMVVW